MKQKYPFQSTQVDTASKSQDIDSIKLWLNHQPHIPAISDEFILLFLHSCYFSIERTKDTIDNYFTVRAQCSDLFKGRDQKFLTKQLDTFDMVFLPNLTVDKYRIVLYRLRTDDVNKFVLSDAVRTFFAINDLIISEDGLMDGYIVVFDMAKLSFSHLAKATTQLSVVKNFMVYIQECHPVRLKSIHVINSYPLIDKILSLLKPMMHSNLIQMLHLHPTFDTVPEFFNLDLLPRDYDGGSCESVDALQENMQSLVSRYAGWLKDFEKFEANEKKRVGKARKDLVGSELGGSFKSLSID